MLKRIYSRLKTPQLSEEDQLIQLGHQTKRYQETSFIYKQLQLQVSDLLSVSYQIKEYFGDERLKFITNKKQPVIIDCGANVGVSVLYFKSLYPHAKIEAFEPDPNICSYLLKNLSQNNIQDVVVHEKAVWNTNDGVSFGVEGADGGSVFLQAEKQIQLPSIRLKDVLEKYDSIDFLKIDIEGAELEVMKDAESELFKVNHLFVEYHSWVNQPQELDVLLKILTQNGFRYMITSIGAQVNQPYIKVDAYNGMDIQLNIFAFKK
jgi:FkbM family methyltransferase